MALADPAEEARHAACATVVQLDDRKREALGAVVHAHDVNLKSHWLRKRAQGRQQERGTGVSGDKVQWGCGKKNNAMAVQGHQQSAKSRACGLQERGAWWRGGGEGQARQAQASEHVWAGWRTEGDVCGREVGVRLRAPPARPFLEGALPGREPRAVGVMGKKKGANEGT